MIPIKEVEQIHQGLIESFGGTSGLRDKAALESALQRPFQTFNQAELYPTVFEKASALLESLLGNHPFVDGNKRTGYTITRLFLLQNNFDINATQEQKYDFIIGIASGVTKYDQILAWITEHSINTSGA
jgi:death on curing protein